ncbi:MAG: ATP-binding protein [Bacteroidota bacterium]
MQIPSSPVAQVVLNAVILVLLFSGLLFALMTVFQRKIRLKQKELYEAMIGNLEAEQMKIGRDLHDQTSPFLSAIRHHLDTHTGHDETLNQLLESSLFGIRSAYHNLSPPGLLDNSLEFAVRHLVTNVYGNSGITFNISFRLGGMTIHDQGGLHLYRIIAELTGNAVKYANATAITVEVEAGPKSVTVLVQDNGTGMDVSVAVYSTGLGWQSINNRIQILNGNKTIVSDRSGTKIAIEVPRTSVS